MTGSMRALVFTEIGKQELKDVPLPSIDNEDEILIKVRAVGICGSDLHGYTGQSGRRSPPLIMGHEAAGEVMAVGPAVERIKPRDRVAVQPIDRRKPKRRLMGMDAPGAYAEYVVWPEENLFPLSDKLSFETAAYAEPLAVAVHAVKRSEVSPSERVFIAGAGAIGLLILLVLKHIGIENLIVSDLSDSRLALAKALGADSVINSSVEGVASVLAREASKGVDVAFEAVGVAATVQQSLAALRGGGRAVWVGNNHRMVELDMQEVVTRELQIIGSYGMTSADFEEALRLLEAGSLPVDKLTGRRAMLEEGETLFDELLASPEVVKCIIAPEITK